MLLRIALLALLLAAPLGAQKPAAEPRRPRLAAGADTADSRAYYRHAVSVLQSKPQEAADALYWTTRLDPSFAEALYARRVALMLSDTRRLTRYMDGNRRTRESPDVKAMDSLHYRALMRDPYLYRQYDELVFLTLIRSAYEHSTRFAPTERLNDAELQFAIDVYLRGEGVETSAWVAYCRGDFAEALRLYTEALKSARDKSDVYAERARVWYLRGAYDSAAADMSRAVEELRNRDTKEVVVLYNSKALYEHSVGLALEKKQDTAGARAAYSRALQEDLAYYPAHLRLAVLSLTAGDTAAAIASLDLAAQVAPGESFVLLEYGSLLMVAGRHDEAAVHLLRAIEIEPLYAALHFALAQALDGGGSTAEAVARYRVFLDRASRNSPLRAVAERRITALGGGSEDP